MSLKTCPECGLKKDRFTPEGICQTCHWKLEEEAERREHINTSMPNGIIARWNCTPSYLDKKLNYMYLRIPNTQIRYFDPDKEYEIVVLGVNT